MTITTRSKRRKSKFVTFSLFCGCGGEHMGKTMALKKLIPINECQFFALNRRRHVATEFSARYDVL